MRAARLPNGERSILRISDTVTLGIQGLAARRARTSLAALGIAVAIAALVAVLGLSQSAKAALLSQLGSEGNLLTVAAGQTFDGNPTPLPLTAESMIRAIPPVNEVTAVGILPDATVRASAAISPTNTNGISLVAAQSTLLGSVSGRVLQGSFLGTLADRYPVVVLGFSAAKNLGVATLSPETQVFIAGSYYTVVGILAPITVAPELDDSAFISFAFAATEFGFDGSPTRIYVRSDPDQVATVAAVLPFTASPQQPDAVEVRRPSDILVARIAAKTSFENLYLGLAGIALLVGGVGIANIMVISVLERRAEIGLRRALGARARHVAAQFFVESILLSCLGGVIGVFLGVLATWAIASIQGSPTQFTGAELGWPLLAAIAVGCFAGVYPARRAGRMPPTEALRGE
jgi:putative ABC transport system permease protein